VVPVTDKASVRVTIREPGYTRVREFSGAPQEIERLCQEAGSFVFGWPTTLARAQLLPTTPPNSRGKENK
jgi:hypothetical protein